MRIGFTCSTFDPAHAGHIPNVERCKRTMRIFDMWTTSRPALLSEKKSPVQTIVERFTPT